MKKSNIIAFFTIVSVVFLQLTLNLLHTQTVLATTGGQDKPYLGLHDFLAGLGISLDEYIGIVAAFEEDGVYPHYLENNASRYETYQNSNPGISVSTAIAYVNANADLDPYTDIVIVPELERNSITMLLNKNFGLPVGWSAGDLVDVGAGFMMRDEAAKHLVEMRDIMRNAGLRFQLQSTYRAGTTSERLYNNAVANYGRVAADAGWARGGHSEHQTGLSADILHRSDTLTLTEARFDSTDEFKWMCENAHKYGFILRYPLEYEDITGYKFEPWHWRYIGIDIATVMYDMGITVYEEFYGKYLASDVLHNVSSLILEQRAVAEAEEAARLEREEAERQASEEAARAAQAAAEAERIAAEEAAELEAIRQAEEARMAAQHELEEKEESARLDAIVTLLVCMGLVVAIIGSAIGMNIMYKRKWGYV